MNDDTERALHEAAHAVVAVRLNLPLQSTDIVTRPMVDVSGQALPAGTAVQQGGVTKIADEAIVRCFDNIIGSPDLAVIDSFAVMLAAGIEAEVRLGNGVDSVRCRDDEYNLVLLAGVSEIGTSTADQAVQQWIRSHMTRAWQLLKKDGKRAWHDVGALLAQRRSLTGDEVRKVMVTLSSR